MGVSFDTKLVMDSAIDEIAAKANTRLQTLLRGQRYFSCAALIKLYKSQVLSYIEYATPAIYHAPRFFLHRLDCIQNRLLEALGLSPVDALVHFNLAPLETRRDISMLGIIHRAALGKGPVGFTRFFYSAEKPAFPRGLRHVGRHSHQLHELIDGTQTSALGRSVFCLIYPYNLLPSDVIQSQTVKLFQRRLQNAVTGILINYMT